jgi:DNA-binding response OmpR family regulator
MKHLHLLIHTRDVAALQALRPVLEFLGVTAENHGEEERAVRVAMGRHFDGFIVDFAAGVASKAVVAGIRAAPSNAQSPVIALIDGPATLRWAEEIGLNIVFNKPISIAYLRASLRIALLSMAREHLRYFRHRICTPAFISCADRRVLEADTINVSSDGLGVRLAHPTKLSNTVRVRFQLPGTDKMGTDKIIVDAQGETAWADTQGRVGIRFEYMPQKSRQDFQRGLADLNSRATADLALHCF